MSYNNDFKFDNRYLLLIYITDYIKLNDRSEKNILSQQDYESLSVWLKKEYPNETLRLWEFVDNGDYEYYLQTGSRLSSVYIYIVMAQFKEKASFRNPKGFNKMKEEEKKAALRLCYPK